MRCSESGCGEEICRHGCLREHEVLVRNLVYHITRSPNDVDDLVQEVMVKAYQSMSAFRGGSFRAYLAQIARNHCYDWMRRLQAKRAIQQVELVPEMRAGEDLGPEAALLQKESTTELMALLDELGHPDREILLLRHVHGLEYTEIAAALQMSPGAVRTRMSRARQKVMEKLQGRERHGSSQLG
ncbi:RNA polymerase sigma factor SigX [Alicyclobacillus contaminans]|uniref:RNA polymerase sigma factor n=1 Tax=Alicyclobacillus contaminans TaxID=392016 RepID=UPI00040557A6|nr:RNA polymerase sigma factor [Alicyclobacillus contaminans]GMA49587.1 RNA polymerase sigma factor SigX [Alicyclobacillus contaminans]